MQPDPATPRRCALFVAHPSHELRVHAWLERARPRVHVLTTGAGRGDVPRLPATAALLDGLGIARGSIFGRLSDRALYDAMLRVDTVFVVALARELADDLIRHEITMIVGDAAEGYSTAHDVARYLIDAAVALAAARGRRIANYEFAVSVPPEPFDPADGTSIWIQLDDAAAARKLLAARSHHPKLAADIEAALTGAPFPAIRRFSEPDLATEALMALVPAAIERLRADPARRGEIDAILKGSDLDEFRVERLRPATTGRNQGEGPRFYETYGEQLVAAGLYQQVIGYRAHIAPIRRALAALGAA